MALYNYKCQTCGKETSEISQEPKQSIPCDCGQPQERVWTAPALQFKGAGYTPKFHAYDKKYGFKG